MVFWIACAAFSPYLKNNGSSLEGMFRSKKYFTYICSLYKLEHFCPSRDELQEVLQNYESGTKLNLAVFSGLKSRGHQVELTHSRF